MSAWGLREPLDLSSRRTWGVALATATLGALIGLTIYFALLRPATASVPRSPDPYSSVIAAVRRARGVKILFVGNSLTAVNELPRLVVHMAHETPGMPRQMFAIAWAPPGSSLQDADADPGFRRLLAATRWNAVVLQEKSAWGGVWGRAPSELNADVAALAAQVRRLGAVPLLFETWGNRDGTDPQPFAFEQAAFTRNYRLVARDQHVALAPVGEAWARAEGVLPGLPLWESDGHHPSLTGSYLAASVITSCLGPVVAHRANDPATSSYSAGLEPRLAAWLRRVAWVETRHGRCT